MGYPPGGDIHPIFIPDFVNTLLDTPFGERVAVAFHRGYPGSFSVRNRARIGDPRKGSWTRWRVRLGWFRARRNDTE